MAAARGDSFFSALQTAVANVNRQANGSGVGDALLYTSQRRRTARKPQPIIFFILPLVAHANMRTPAHSLLQSQK